MKKALLIGNNIYDADHIKNLSACVNDAKALAEELRTSQIGGTVVENFGCKELTSDTYQITRARVMQESEKFFRNPGGAYTMALFYFSGHGYEDGNGGILATKDAANYDVGIRVQEIINMANRSSIPNIVVILDCCYSGNAGNQVGYAVETAELKNGLTVLTSSSVGQTSVELNGMSIFTYLICQALQGGGADVIGNVSVASLYYFVDRILGPFEQRPIFKSHVSNSVILRQVKGTVARKTLSLLPSLFPQKEDRHKLDPAYEPDKNWIDAAIRSNPENEKELENWRIKNPAKEATFAQLQDLEGAGLVIPNGEKHMYHAAIRCKSCSLTPIGKFYWTF